MSKKEKIEVIKRLIRKGKRFAAEVACFDWKININEVLKDDGLLRRYNQKN